MDIPSLVRPMGEKLLRLFSDPAVRHHVDRRASEFKRVYIPSQREDLDRRVEEYRRFANTYYDLVTDFYEFGWGRSFHFAPQAPGESFAASLARHEHRVAHVLGLRAGMRVIDLGCGIGGPARQIARFSGASIVGLNNNPSQVERARRITEKEGLDHLVSYRHGDFMQVDAPDASFDAAYMVEASGHAPDRAALFAEVFRLLKPGCGLASYEWCMTDSFDPDDPHHAEVRAYAQTGVHDCPGTEAVDQALSEAGFEILETRDAAHEDGVVIPWYEALNGSGWSRAAFRRSRVGRWVTHRTVRLLELFRIVPRGTTEVAGLLNKSADALVEAGRLGIFTPCYFVHVRRPR